MSVVRSVVVDGVVRVVIDETVVTLFTVEVEITVRMIDCVSVVVETWGACLGQSSDRRQNWSPAKSHTPQPFSADMRCATIWRVLQAKFERIGVIPG